MVIYIVQAGERYAVNKVVSLHEGLAGARIAAESLAGNGEQLPPAEGAVASWLDESLFYVCITAIETQP